MWEDGRVYIFKCCGTEGSVLRVNTQGQCHEGGGCATDEGVGCHCSASLAGVCATC